MATKFHVVCEEYVDRGFADRASAERKLEQITEAQACRLDHHIVESLPGESRDALIERLGMQASF